MNRRNVWESLWRREEIRSHRAVDAKVDPLFKLLEYFSSITSGRIIEVGCGAGSRTLQIAKRYGLSATFLDFTLEALKLVRKKAQNSCLDVDTILADLLYIPLREGFDVVWSADVHEHFAGSERQKAFDELRRICKDGGKVIVVVPNLLNLPYRAVKLLKSLARTWPYGYESPFTQAELRNRMMNARLYAVQVVGIGAVLSLFRWTFHDTRFVTTMLRSPTPLKKLNQILLLMDLKVGKYGSLNYLFGRELAACGYR